MQIGVLDRNGVVSLFYLLKSRCVFKYSDQVIMDWANVVVQFTRIALWELFKYLNKEHKDSVNSIKVVFMGDRFFSTTEEVYKKVL